MTKPLSERVGVEEHRAYLFRNVVEHLNDLMSWPALFDLLESKPFLADQAQHFNGFERSGEDIERYVVPAAIRLGDWTRFLTFASLALNLRQLAETLAEPEILGALAEGGGGSLALALDTARRLASPQRRVEARARLASSCRARSDLLEGLQREIEEDLERLVPAASTLAILARCLGPELYSRWPEWIARWGLGAAEETELWASAAECWLDRGETRAARFWEALARVRNDGRCQALIGRLAGQDREALDVAVSRLAELFEDDPHARRRALATYLGEQVRIRPEESLTAWERWAEGDRFPWSVDLVETCREIFLRLGPDRVDRLGLVCEGVEAEAALRIIELESRPDGETAGKALEAVCRIVDGPAKLHWSLRYLEARRLESAETARGQLGAVAVYLRELRYGAAASDLRRFLDLAADLLPGETARLVEDVAWSPASRAETLVALASQTGEVAVAEQVLAHAERFAAAVSLTEAEGFKLRGEVVRRAACRLCLLRESLDHLDAAVELLLPEEEDELRATLAPALAKAGRAEQARVVAEGIRDPGRKFLTLLRALPLSALPPEFLKPRSLYGALASTSSLDEERLALVPLLQPPFEPQDLARRYLSPLHYGDLQAQGLLRLARHTLAFQSAFYGRRQDRLIALEVVRGSLAVETDERLASLTPEIAALGAEMGGAEAVAELQEAGRRLADLPSLPWALRFSSLEHLISLLPAVVPWGRPRGRDCRRAAALLASWMRLPIGSTADPAIEDLRRHWHELLPLLAATLARFPAGAMRSLLKAMRKGVDACRERTDEIGRKIFALCSAAEDERALLARASIASGEGEPRLLIALAYLLAAIDSSQALEIAGLLPPHLGDPLRLRLIRFGWINGKWARPLAKSMADSALRREAFVWIEATAGSEADWIGELAAWIAESPFDPSAPGCAPLLERLWRTDPNLSRPLLAGAFLQALRAKGRQGGEQSLLLWLHAHHAPKLGGESGTLDLAEQSGRALSRSLSLPGREG